MRIDLSLQRIKFCDPKFFCRFHLLVHKLLYFSSHIVIGIYQITNLVMINRAFHGNRRSLTDLAHLPDHRGDPAAYRPGQKMSHN